MDFGMVLDLLANRVGMGLHTTNYKQHPQQYSSPQNRLAYFVHSQLNKSIGLTMVLLNQQLVVLQMVTHLVMVTHFHNPKPKQC